jgi:hypothetical protein
VFTSLTTKKQVTKGKQKKQKEEEQKKPKAIYICWAE